MQVAHQPTMIGCSFFFLNTQEADLPSLLDLVKWSQTQEPEAHLRLHSEIVLLEKSKQSAKRETTVAVCPPRVGPMGQDSCALGRG